MLKKIEGQEMMTVWDAMNKYRDYYFHMVITKKVDGGDNDLGYVIYTYDNKREAREIPRSELEGKVVGRFIGVAAEKGTFIGGMEFHGKI